MGVSAKTCFLAFTFFLLLVFLAEPVAAASFNVVVEPDVVFYLEDYGTFIYLPNVLYAEEIVVYGDKVEFKYASFDQVYVLSFNISVINGNLTIEEIGEDVLKIVVEAPSGTWSHVVLEAGKIPPYVVVSKGPGHSEKIEMSKYFSKRSDFDAYPAEAVFMNETGWIELKGQHASPITWTIYFSPPPQSGGTAGGGVAYPSPAQPVGEVVAQPYVPSQGVAIIVALVAAAAIIANVRSKPKGAKGLRYDIGKLDRKIRKKLRQLGGGR